MIRLQLPRFVIAKDLKGGATFYWNPPNYWRKQAETQGRLFPFSCETLGIDLNQAELDAAAAKRNAAFEEWRLGPPDAIRRYAAYGSVDWLFENYLASDIFARRVGVRARADYRRLFRTIGDIPTRDGRRFGELTVASVTPAAAEKIYAMMITGDRFRTGEKAVMYCKTAWKLMQPHHPKEFRRDVPNPWASVQLVSWIRGTKPAVGRDQVYTFADKALELGQPEFAAAAVICFEWLQRPENVLAGYVRWGDYEAGVAIRIEHHKTGKMVRHPLSELVDGHAELFYADAEAILARMPKRGVPIVLGPAGTPWEPTRSAQLVRRIADAADLPKIFTLDACRHGGMTELEEAELTDGQGRALSAHSSNAYNGYAKRTEKRMLAATRKRIAYRRAG